MGVNLTPIICKRIIKLDDLEGRTLAVDANNVLYQFLALIRTPDGSPLKSRDGRITSHLAGLLYRSTRLISNYNMNLIFVFDGKPPRCKEREIEKRRQVRRRAEEEWREALKAGDYARAFSKAVMTSRLTREMVEDAKKLLSLLGIPYVQAPSEGEAQAAYMAVRGDVWASSSRDYDSLLFGTPRLIRYLTISGREFLPSLGISRPLEPELITLGELLFHHGITRKQLVDVAILIGTDFNRGVRGIGPKRALDLIRRYGCIEKLPEIIRRRIPENYDEVREIFLRPDVNANYEIKYGCLKREELYEFLCEELDFSRDRVGRVIDRMLSHYKRMSQSRLERWIP